MIVDATNTKVGRMATFVAKAALKGEKVIVINAEKAVFTGSKVQIIQKYRNQHDRGRKTKGPFQPRMPDRFLRRIIRSMLPYKTPRGRDAFKRVMVHMGNPTTEQGIVLKEAVLDLDKSRRYVTVNDVCKALGGRV